ncbi:hypothetical protein EU99_0345 [Prochlorococcus marinus str. MIT 9321]|uniref:Uncharacterized protein n=1 Tax=Prochlorococcus marinus str. MIT 9401 TaxID=167551 RepID=A0A0A2B339_PROMR|nr:hypothetical protein EV00_1559 [Prochlorococcus marinus str. MIT 9322]KGG05017.1 hypothetical protein EU99_0345 [Prochlorococcus marinus str. MIT 9321]KGG07210.1 hypothetical protein EV01_1546 [Prochlorococcus marinus str. MIT 9401]
MKLAINISLFIFTLLLIDNKSFSLTDNKIKKICETQKRKTICIKILKEKRYNLQKGNLIEIPVIPYKR